MGAVKAMLRGKFMAIQDYLNKQEKHQISNLILHLKHLEKIQDHPHGKEMQKSKMAV